MSFSHPDGSPAENPLRAQFDRKLARWAYYLSHAPCHRRAAGMLVLQELGGWTVSDIAVAFRLHHANVVRAIRDLRASRGEAASPWQPFRPDGHSAWSRGRDDAAGRVLHIRRRSPQACRDQAVLTLHALGGWSVREIAREVGMHHANVVRAIDRAKRSLSDAGRNPESHGFQNPRGQ